MALTWEHVDRCQRCGHGLYQEQPVVLKPGGIQRDVYQCGACRHTRRGPRSRHLPAGSAMDFSVQRALEEDKKKLLELLKQLPKDFGYPSFQKRGVQWE